MTVDMDDGGRVAIYSCGKHDVHPAVAVGMSLTTL